MRACLVSTPVSKRVSRGQRNSSSASSTGKRPRHVRAESSATSKRACQAQTPACSAGDCASPASSNRSVSTRDGSTPCSSTQRTSTGPCSEPSPRQGTADAACDTRVRGPSMPSPGRWESCKSHPNDEANSLRYASPTSPVRVPHRQKSLASTNTERRSTPSSCKMSTGCGSPPGGAARSPASISSPSVPAPQASCSGGIVARSRSESAEPRGDGDVRSGYHSASGSRCSRSPKAVPSAESATNTSRRRAVRVARAMRCGSCGSGPCTTTTRAAASRSANPSSDSRSRVPIWSHSPSGSLNQAVVGSALTSAMSGTKVRGSQSGCAVMNSMPPGPASNCVTACRTLSHTASSSPSRRTTRADHTTTSVPTSSLADCAEAAAGSDTCGWSVTVSTCPASSRTTSVESMGTPSRASTTRARCPAATSVAVMSTSTSTASPGEAKAGAEMAATPVDLSSRPTS